MIFKLGILKYYVINMALQYTLSDIFKYEDITRQYCNSEGGFTLSIQELIHLAALEDEFDTDYANYLIFKRLHQITEYIYQKAINKGIQINVKDNKKLKEDLENNNANVSNYENWIEFYEREAFNDEPTIYDIINQAIRDNNWNVLYYLYYKEENKLYDILFNEKNKLNDRKFFIIQ